LYIHRSLQVFHRELLPVIFRILEFPLEFVLRLSLGLVRGHERFLLVHWATLFHLRIILHHLYNLLEKLRNSSVLFRTVTCSYAIVIILIPEASSTPQCIACIVLWSVYTSYYSNLLFWCTHFTVNDHNTVVNLWLWCLCPAHWCLQSTESLFTKIYINYLPYVRAKPSLWCILSLCAPCLQRLGVLTLHYLKFE